MTIALTGGTGFVGQTLIDRALARGFAIRALTRRPQQPRAGVEWVEGDLADRAALRALVTGAEAVIHVAGVVNAADAAGFEAGNITGTLELVEAAVAAGVPRMIFVSSLAARQPNLSDYGASKARAEKIVSASSLDWTIIRPPAIYGPRDREMFDLFRAARWGIVPVPPQGRLSVIHVGDLADALLAALPSGEGITHCLFEVDDGQSDGWTNHAFARLVGAAVGRRIWAPHLSRAMLMRIAALDRFFRRSKAKLTIDRVNYMTHPDWVANPRKAVPAALWKPVVDTREGLAETARWYREQGWF